MKNGELRVEYKCVLLTAFSRGHWMAAHLKKMGLKTLVIDLSNQLGPWPAEDTEFPFGFFKSDKYSDSFQQWFAHYDPFVENEQGFCLWLNDGPLELKSNLTQHRLKILGLDELATEFLAQSKLKLNETEIKKINSNSFRRSWLVHFAHQIASPIYRANAKSVTPDSRALPLFSNFSRRQFSRPANQDSLNWLKSQGVDVADSETVLDIALQNPKEAAGLELKGKVFNGLVRFEQLVCLLTSEELDFYNQKLAQAMFPKGTLESEWCWLRYRLKLKDHQEWRNVPAHFCMLMDENLPWTHENCMIMQKTSSPENLDVWVRLPSVQRFNREYLVQHGDKILNNFFQRLPLSDASVLQYPQEYYYTYKELGAPRFPVFSENILVKQNSQPFRNVYRADSEVMATYSYDAMFEFQDKLASHIHRRWREIEDLRQKREAKA